MKKIILLSIIILWFFINQINANYTMTENDYQISYKLTLFLTNKILENPLKRTTILWLLDKIINQNPENEKNNKILRNTYYKVGYFTTKISYFVKIEKNKLIYVLWWNNTEII